jgi:protein tyrosine phosphatase (PTP) superfamily phosphohydrolase (DUF442 family)
MGTETIYNYYRVDDEVITGGQPTAEELRAAADKGVRTVVNLATFDPRRSLPGEGALVRELGMAYHHIPVDWGRPTAADFAVFEQILLARPPGKILIHCIANMRVTAFYALYALKHLGWTEAEAEALRGALWQGSHHPVWEAFVDRMKARIRDARSGRQA